MDLNKQPPRRPSNISVGGIVGVGRLVDKARAHNEELLGAYKYGESSGLDRQILAFIGMSADEFARAAEHLGDAEIGELVVDKAQKVPDEVALFNRNQLGREPEDDMHRRLLVERLAAYAPGNTEIRTVLASMELDDWGLFRTVDLRDRPPRTPYLRSVMGIVAVARVADKARAAREQRLGEYQYGTSSSLDSAVLEFLGLSEEQFMDGAYENPNDVELGEWISERTDISKATISAFNAIQTDRGRADASRERFVIRRGELCPQRTDLNSWFDLIDHDDEASFGLTDLTRHPPRSPYAMDVSEIVGLARMVDKGRAFIGDTLGDYWYGEDSGIDRQVLELLGMTQDEFTEQLRISTTDELLADWLSDNLGKSSEQIEEFNTALRIYGPTNERQWKFLRRAMAGLDPRRKDIASFLAFTQLEDGVAFARLKSGV